MQTTNSERSWLVLTTIALVLSFVGSISLVLFWFGSIHNCIEFARGKQIIVEQVVWNKTQGRDSLDCDVIVRNLGFSKARVLGFGCTCTNHPVTDLPFSVESGDTQRLQVRVEPLPTPGSLHEYQIRGEIHTDLPRQATIVIDYKSSPNGF